MKEEMNKMTTLNQFIDEVIDGYGLQNDKKTKNKLKTKFTRTLKNLHLWEKAFKKDNKGTKLFTEEQLEKLYQNSVDYLKKLSPDNNLIDVLDNYDKKFIHQPKFDKYLKDLTVKYQQTEENDQSKMPKGLKLELMITALFDHFYTPIDEKQWVDDCVIIKNLDFKHVDPKKLSCLPYIKAMARLLSKNLSAYYSPKGKVDSIEELKKEDNTIMNNLSKYKDIMIIDNLKSLDIDFLDTCALIKLAFQKNELKKVVSIVFEDQSILEKMKRNIDIIGKNDELKKHLISFAREQGKLIEEHTTIDY